MTAGIGFSETMRGPFAMGVLTPQEGEELGRRSGDELRIEVDIHIPDVAHFISHDDASGTIGGAVVYDQIGGRLPASHGDFRLFADSDDPDTKYMIYELSIEAGGQPHYLSGRKVVHDDPGFDMWSDTTTLFTTLHAGDSTDAPIVGAGVLQLGVREMIAMLKTLHTTGDGDLGTLMQFGRYFFGEVWQLFTPRFGGEAEGR